ncbi:MAG: hypothetical protein BMS9Abin13_191 [Patescibacteria group bacterium]|nr:MAG: hypothetical protein BMS9Abin13_191 [Patescibacteria group bacterium]
MSGNLKYEVYEFCIMAKRRCKNSRPETECLSRDRICRIGEVSRHDLTPSCVAHGERWAQGSTRTIKNLR